MSSSDGREGLPTVPGLSSFSSSHISVLTSLSIPLASKPELGARAIAGRQFKISKEDEVEVIARKIRNLFVIMICGASLYLCPAVIFPCHE